MKDEALSPKGDLLQELPIAEPVSGQAQAAAEGHVAKLVEGTRVLQGQRAAVLDLLRMEYGVDKAGNGLSELTGLTSDEFVAEVLKRRPKSLGGLGAAKLALLRKMFEDEVAPLQLRRAAMRDHERALARLVNDAYGLTAAEEKLLWATAPPRMPDAR